MGGGRKKKTHLTFPLYEDKLKQWLKDLLIYLYEHIYFHLIALNLSGHTWLLPANLLRGTIFLISDS